MFIVIQYCFSYSLGQRSFFTVERSVTGQRTEQKQLLSVQLYKRLQYDSLHGSGTTVEDSAVEGSAGSAVCPWTRHGSCTHQLTAAVLTAHN